MFRLHNFPMQSSSNCFINSLCDDACMAQLMNPFHTNTGMACHCDLIRIYQ